MIIDMPLPMPFWVISSPIHISNGTPEKVMIKQKIAVLVV